ncbi:MAG: hypothetical protein KGR26_14450 [Cyanobacteria bacterium REEB65]|nr:hypothetical protein [Cyanobacteria bacterium REEB65]
MPSSKPVLCVVVVLAPLAGSLPACAQGQDPATTGLQQTRALGFAAGFSSGIGFAYREFEPSGWGWGIAGSGSWKPADGSGFGSFGFDAYKTLLLQDWGRFYAVAAAGSLQTFGPFGSLNYDPFEYNVGAGLGISFGGKRGLNLSLEVPLTYSHDSDRKFTLLPLPNVALTYQY